MPWRLVRASSAEWRCPRLALVSDDEQKSLQASGKAARRRDKNRRQIPAGTVPRKQKVPFWRPFAARPRRFEPLTFGLTRGRLEILGRVAYLSA